MKKRILAICMAAAMVFFVGCNNKSEKESAKQDDGSLMMTVAEFADKFNAALPEKKQGVSRQWTTYDDKTYTFRAEKINFIAVVNENGNITKLTLNSPTVLEVDVNAEALIVAVDPGIKEKYPEETGVNFLREFEWYNKLLLGKAYEKEIEVNGIKYKLSFATNALTTIDITK